MEQNESFSSCINILLKSYYSLLKRITKTSHRYTATSKKLILTFIVMKYSTLYTCGTQTYCVNNTIAVTSMNPREEIVL